MKAPYLDPVRLGPNYAKYSPQYVGGGGIAQHLHCLFRPLARAFQRQPAILCPSTIARPALATAQVKSKQTSAPFEANKGLVHYPKLFNPHHWF